MAQMRYEAPDTVDGAIALLAGASGEARLLAGGTDLLVQLRSELIEPELVVDLKGIAELTSIVAEDGGFRIGAAVTGAELGEHAALKVAWPGVVEAVMLARPRSRAAPASAATSATPRRRPTPCPP